MDLLRRQGSRYGGKVAFTFSENGDGVRGTELTYRELDVRARAIAANLQWQGATGERVLVFCRPGLDGIVAVLGCLYAGAVAVPVNEWVAPRLSSVAPGSRARFALASPEMPTVIKTAVDAQIAWTDGRPLRWCGTDVAAADARAWTDPQVDAGDAAMLLYTSASVGSAKGVMLSHDNVIRNLAAMHQAWPGDDHETAVYWLPPHRNMGLIGAVLEMLYIGCSTVLLSPSAFVQRPMRWLEAISAYRGTVTAAPDFAYRLCVERSTPAERAGLDLSSLSTAVNGGERVWESTMRAFTEAFAPAGFRSRAFVPVYGLTEATLLVSGGSNAGDPMVRHVDRGWLRAERVVDAGPGDCGATSVVGCGRPRQPILIVDPDTRRVCGGDELGEIWVSGTGVGHGYWDLEEQTKRTFHATVAGCGEVPFLRTGDVGFVRDGELFVTGRCHDLIVVGGVEHYPSDLELTVQHCHPDFPAGRTAVFAVAPESGGAEHVVVVQEIDRDVHEDEFVDMLSAIQGGLAARHGIQADAVVLVQPWCIPTTSGGKILRDQCRYEFVYHIMEPLARWHAPSPPAVVDSRPGTAVVDFACTALVRRAFRPG
ncbi:fatty acyl-AMP ligase [Mycolicibacter sp. MYC123]|uniref:Fatty acyl-AMP ligase n=1 Tax=[Mycobacterium] zoologicum TaxID=2872311 RepID=A0ABU5YP16_9MYCO|nr:fatty acyl-AMP ligase [Mycolicibacter sp. MYC123]MEB3051808.1 fatty acyl-AMP ligase [Mycolicibacter sp. MYC123]